MPIITERTGIANYVDLNEGMSLREIVDEATGIANKVVIDWKQQPRSADLKPCITICDAKGKLLKLANGMEAVYLMSVDAILNVEHGARAKAGDVLARIPRDPGTRICERGFRRRRAAPSAAPRSGSGLRGR